MAALLDASRAMVADRDGVTAIEYGLIAAIMISAIAVAVPMIGTWLLGAFGSFSAYL